MLVVTPHGRLGYVTGQAGEVSKVLLFEDYAVREYPTVELRPLAAPAGAA